MSTPQNDDEITPRADAKQGADTEQNTDAKQGTDTKKDYKRKSDNERLRHLKQKMEHLKNQHDGLLARQRTRERKRETRRKIIVGAIVLTLAGESEKFREFLRENLDHSIKSERDRELLADLLTKKSQK